MYRVEWLQSALDELADIWVKANSAWRQLITSASDAIERRLQINPFAGSHFLPGGLLIRFVIPLGVSYRVEADGVTVSVLHVWLVLSHNGQVNP